MRRSSSLHSVDDLVAREVSDKYAEVLAVGKSIDDVIYLADTLPVVVPELGKIRIVANNISSVVTTADSINEVNIVAQDLVGAGFSDIEDLGSVADAVEVSPATGVSNIEAVANNIVDVITVSANTVNINTVALDIASVITVAADLNEPVSEINTVALSITNVDTVGTNIVKVSTVADNVANVTTVADNIADVNAVVAQVIPNLAEILLADDNAALVTSIYDQFDDRYLGSKAIAPTLDNDGNVLLVGALYFDTITNTMRVWDGALWSDALTLTAGSISTVTNKVIDSITNQVGADHIHYKVRNASGAIIPIGTVVTAMGTQPGTDYIQVIPVTDPQTQIAIGIVHTTLTNNGTGLAVNRGVHDNANTSAWAVGTILYPDTSGGFTTVKPSSGSYQPSAYVLRQHTSQGTLLVNFSAPVEYVKSADIIAALNAATDFSIDLGGL